MRILTVNAGSSSVKLSLVDGDVDDRAEPLDDGSRLVAERELPAPGVGLDRGELERAVGAGELSGADAVAHRIVHGGERFRDPVLIDDTVVGELRALTDLAPLHQSKSLAALDAVSALLPGLPAVACFDTAFHATMPAVAFTYALPARWRSRWGLRRYGFHGLSHSWVARRVPGLIDAAPADPPPGAHVIGTPRGSRGSPVRIVSCHLGAGASLCAIREGQSVDTTMGFTPLEGLVMATRSGSVDPGMLLWLLEREPISVGQMASALEHESGIAGLAGSADMKAVVSRAGSGDQEAQLAVDVYVHRLRAGIAAMCASLGGLDVLVFTGGVGEHSAELRSRAAEGLRFLGVALDPDANHGGGGDRDLTLGGAAVRTLVLRAREDLEMARQASTVLGPDTKSARPPAAR